MPSGRAPVAAPGRLNMIQWTKPDASGSSTRSTSAAVPSGAPDHARSGERSSPSQVNRAGMSPPTGNAAVVSAKPGDGPVVLAVGNSVEPGDGAESAAVDDGVACAEGRMTASDGRIAGVDDCSPVVALPQPPTPRVTRAATIGMARDGRRRATRPAAGLP